MTQHNILEYAAALRPCYMNTSRSEKSAIVSESCQLTGYHRKAAIRLHASGAAGRRGRPRQYALTLFPVLVEIWEDSDRLCFKRLAPSLPELVKALERHGDLILTADERRQLLQLSPATIDRMLAPVRSSPAACHCRSRARQQRPRRWSRFAPSASGGMCSPAQRITASSRAA